jgi:hypothetical protein
MDAHREETAVARRESPGAIGWMLKRSPIPDQVIDIDRRRLEDEEAFENIRCPLCEWQPSPSSMWSCYGEGTPEVAFEGCGTTWNTFATRGRCPGCAHQWRWTKCLRCGEWSPHDEWYNEGSRR